MTRCWRWPAGHAVQGGPGSRAGRPGLGRPKWLKHQNIELFVPKRDGAFTRLCKLHHKLMVIDGRIVVAGSFNYTQPANEYNDEHISVMGSTHAEVAGVEVEADASRQLAVYLKQEIQRIISLGKPYDPAAYTTRRREQCSGLPENGPSRRQLERAFGNGSATPSLP
jgi:phosphatidylserine/phosphatidylglycerophosphate/cardiolipin synthase-like enzyme